MVQTSKYKFSNASVLMFAPCAMLGVGQRKTTQRSRPRLRSCFARGLQLILVALLKGEPVPLGRFIPEPWPTVLPPGKKPKAKASKNKGKGKKKKGKNKGKRHG